VAGDAALLVDPTDIDAVAGAFARLLEDEELRRSCIEKGIARAAAFTWERAARLTLEVYKKEGQIT
jgi:glycosyltransferase involved in cell wall biosynthesis